MDATRATIRQLADLLTGTDTANGIPEIGQITLQVLKTSEETG